MPRPALMTKRPGGRTKWLAVVLVTALSTAVAVMTFGSPDMKRPGVADAAEVGTTVGTAQYPVPAGAVVVSPSGNDSAAGTAAAPYRTLDQGGIGRGRRRDDRVARGDVSRVGRRLQARHDPIVAGRDGVARRFGTGERLGRIQRQVEGGLVGRARRVTDVHTRRARQHRGLMGVRQPELPDGRASGSDLDRRRRAAPSGIARRSHAGHVLPR